MLVLSRVTVVSYEHEISIATNKLSCEERYRFSSFGMFFSNNQSIVAIC